MKKTLLNILLGASLFFGAGNLKGQQEGVLTISTVYNSDKNDFWKDLLGWKREGFNELKQKYPRYADGVGLTILYWRDKDNDNFHENIIVLNCYHFYSVKNLNYVKVEDFYIDKKTGIIDYTIKGNFINLNILNRDYAGEDFTQIAEREYTIRKSHPYLTPQKLYDMGIDERVKKLINTGESGDKSEIKRLAGIEREYVRDKLLNIE